MTYTYIWEVKKIISLNFSTENCACKNKQKQLWSNYKNWFKIQICFTFHTNYVYIYIFAILSNGIASFGQAVNCDPDDPAFSIEIEN